MNWKQLNSKYLIICVSSFLLLNFSFPVFSQTIKILDSEKEGIADVECYVYSADKNIQYISDDNGIIRPKETSYDSIVFNHPAYFSQTLTKANLEKTNYHVVLKLQRHMYKPVYFRHNPDFETQKDHSNKLVSLKPKEVKFYEPQTTADFIGLSNQVFVQKSQMGGGSPMIRGFSANNVLIVVDGVRMNNAIFRDGNIQNIITIDPNIIQEAQIIFGPGSVYYGSDAMGGVMAFETKTPKIDTSGYYDGNVMLRTSSANRETSWHVDLSYGKKKFAGLSSISLSNYGELRMGKNGPEEYTRPTFTEYNGTTDSIIKNEDENIQYFTSYSQININQKLRYQLDSLNDFIFHFGYATSSPIPRYDRLLMTNQGLPRYGDWYYGPQKWLQLNARYIRLVPNKKLADKITTVVARQRFEESRFVRPFRTFNLEVNEEKVLVNSINIDLDKVVKKTDIMYGLEAVNNTVFSKGQGSQIDSNYNFDIASRYPNNSTLNTVAGYLSLKTKWRNKWLASAGTRYTFLSVYAPFNNSFYDFPFDEIRLQKSAVSGSLGLRRMVGKESYFYANVASGFRAPNIDDLGKIFDSEPNRVIVPNDNLLPEYSYTGELGVHATIKQKFEVLFNAYYTIIDNVIIRDDFSLNGSDSLFYAGQMLRIQSLTNADQATVNGYEIQFKAEINQELDFKTAFNIISGSTSDGQPLRHVTPNFGNTTLTWKHKKWKCVAYSNYNMELSNDKFAPSEQSKTHIYALDDNNLPYSPAWWTLNLKSGIKFSSTLTANFGIENILNKRYRPYSSGVSAPGRNFIVSINGKL